MVLSGFYFLFGVSNWTILLATTLIDGLVLIIWRLLCCWGQGGAWCEPTLLGGILRAYPFSSNSDLPFEFLADCVRRQPGGMAVLWGLGCGPTA